MVPSEDDAAAAGPAWHDLMLAALKENDVRLVWPTCRTTCCGC